MLAEIYKIQINGRLFDVEAGATLETDLSGMSDESFMDGAGGFHALSKYEIKTLGECSLILLFKNQDAEFLTDLKKSTSAFSVVITYQNNSTAFTGATFDKCDVDFAKGMAKVSFKVGIGEILD